MATFYFMAVVLAGVAGALANLGLPFFIGLGAFAAQLAWQATRVRVDDGARALRLFKSNAWAGLILFAAAPVSVGVVALQ